MPLVFHVTFQLGDRLLKLCRDCGIEKEDGSFHPASNGGLRHPCKECYNRRESERRKNLPPEKKELIARRGYEWKKNNPERVRATHLVNTYGITWEEYEVMYDSHDGSCWLCHKEFDGLTKCSAGPYVDHCHETGRVRGLLCAPCNQLVGLLERHGLDKMNELVSYVEGGESN